MKMESKFVTYTSEEDLIPLSEQGWMIYAIIVLSGLSGVYLRRIVK